MPSAQEFTQAESIATNCEPKEQKSGVSGKSLVEINADLTESNRQLRERLTNAEKERQDVLLQIRDLESKANERCDQLREELEQEKQDHAMCVTRWREALDNPIPAEGTMPEPAESLYRKTEKLRTALAAAKEALEYAQHRARCQYALTTDELATVKTNYDNALARIAECEKDPT